MVFKHKKVWNEPLALTLNSRCFNDTALKHMFFLIIRWIRMAFQAVQNVRRRWAPELQQLSDHIEKLEESGRN